MCYKSVNSLLTDPTAYTNYDKYLIVLEKLPDTLTNEGRQNVYSMNRARFRADKLFVHKIINIDTGRLVSTFTNRVWCPYELPVEKSSIYSFVQSRFEARLPSSNRPQGLQRRPQGLLRRYDLYWSVTYTVNEIVEPSNGFDSDINSVSAPGIHYFKNIVCALAYKVPNSDYAGRWIYWGNNGQRRLTGFYTSGQLILC